MSGRGFVRIVVVGALIVCSASASSMPAAAAGSRFQVKKHTVSPGVVWERIVDSTGPNRINALIVTPSDTTSVDVASSGSFPEREQTSQMASAAGAVAAVNGDFGAFEGRPTHPFVMDAAWIENGFRSGQVFAMSADQTSSYMGLPSLTAQATSSSGAVPISRWNTGGPRNAEVDAFTSAGGSLIRPPSNGCQARLTPASGYSWTAGKLGLTRTYTVEASRCSGGLAPSGHDIVLAARSRSTRKPWFDALAPGDAVRVDTSLGWAGVQDAIGGWPMLLESGSSVLPSPCTWDLCTPNPRTGVGVTSGCMGGSGPCRVILLTVDGREPGYSVGMTLPQFAAEFKRLGAAWALNLDGGGSTTMWIAGRGIVNRPSDTPERTVVNALVVLPHRDHSDPLK